MKFLPALASSVATLVLVACGAQDADVSHVAAALPDLRFASPIVQMAVPGAAALLNVSQGATISVGCNTSGLRGLYRYGNGGTAFAGAHVNRGQTIGTAPFDFAQAGLGVGAVRSTWASFGAILVPNTPTTVVVRLDSGGAVAELNEGNNVWWARVVRKCP